MKRITTWLLFFYLPILAFHAVDSYHYFMRPYRGDIAAAKAQMQIFEVLLDRFETDIGRFPSMEEGLLALIKDPDIGGWSGPYLSQRVLPKDPWGNNFVYECPSGVTDSYKLYSLGPDGTISQDDLTRDTEVRYSVGYSEGIRKYLWQIKYWLLQIVIIPPLFFGVLLCKKYSVWTRVFKDWEDTRVHASYVGSIEYGLISCLFFFALFINRVPEEFDSRGTSGFVYHPSVIMVSLIAAYFAMRSYWRFLKTKRLEGYRCFELIFPLIFLLPAVLVLGLLFFISILLSRLTYTRLIAYILCRR